MKVKILSLLRGVLHVSGTGAAAGGGEGGGEREREREGERDRLADGRGRVGGVDRDIRGLTSEHNLHNTPGCVYSTKTSSRRQNALFH